MPLCVFELVNYAIEKYNIPSADKIVWAPMGCVKIDGNGGPDFYLKDHTVIKGVRVNSALCEATGKVYISMGEPVEERKHIPVKPCK